MRCGLIAVAASLTVATSCASAQEAETPSPPPANRAATPSAEAATASSPNGPSRPSESATASPTAQTIDAEPTDAPVPARPDPIEVGDGHLPTEIANAFENAGADLVVPDEWTRRFGAPAGFPELRGSSGRLVEALSRIEATDAGWRRTDEMSWLVLDDRDRDELLTDLAKSLGASDGWEATTVIDQGAQCALAQLPTIANADWTIQGCGYPRFTDLHALGVTRRADTTDQPDVLDTSMSAVAASLGGHTTFSEVRLGQPSPDGSTLHLSAQVRFDVPIDVDTASERLTTDVLPGWQVLKGEDSVRLSGPTGATWTVTSTVAVFEWAGQW